MASSLADAGRARAHAGSIRLAETDSGTPAVFANTPSPCAGSVKGINAREPGSIALTLRSHVAPLLLVLGLCDPRRTPRSAHQRWRYELLYLLLMSSPLIGVVNDARSLFACIDVVY